MIIYLPIKLLPTGGTSMFARKFKSGMAKRGHTVTFTYRPDYDVLLAAPTCSYRALLHAKLSHKIIVQRLDGTYYPTTVAGKRYHWYNLPLKIIHQNFADATIYQSGYSEYCTRQFLGARRHQLSTIIYNGVDTQHFSPHGPRHEWRDNPAQQVFITWSRFRRTDQLVPLIRGIQAYRERYNSNVKLVVAGDFTPPLPSDAWDVLALWGLPRVPWITFTGPVRNLELPRYARGADVFVMTHLNPPCPNNVLEAQACGLPVCGVADGAMPEITQPGATSELLKISGDAFYAVRDYDIQGFAKNLRSIILHQQSYALASRNLAVNRFDLADMCRHYDNFLSQVKAARL